MARAPKTAEAPKTTAVANWDEELAKLATASAEMEAGSGNGQFFTTRAGQLGFNGEVFPGNEMGVIILDSVIEHVFYEGRYDADNPQPPACFAFGRGSDYDMSPHDTVVDHDQAVNETCKGCPNGEFGSAETGKGRACRWIRRLACLPAGGFMNGVFKAETDPDHFEKAEVAYLKVSPTSVRNYSGLVKQVSTTLRKPLLAIYTKVKVVPDPKTQFQIQFSAIEEVPSDIIPVLLTRLKAQQELTAFPYNLDAAPAEQPAPAAPARRGASAKTAAAATPAKRPKKY